LITTPLFVVAFPSCPSWHDYRSGNAEGVEPGVAIPARARYIEREYWEYFAP
jgi:hypothetical protein